MFSVASFANTQAGHMHNNDHDFLNVNVGGTNFVLLRSNLQEYPLTFLYRFSRLGHSDRLRVCDGYFSSDGFYFFDRPAILFESIAMLYRIDEIRPPFGICAEIFERELKFWNVDRYVKVKCDCCPQIKLPKKAEVSAIYDTRLKPETSNKLRKRSKSRLGQKNLSKSSSASGSFGPHRTPSRLYAPTITIKGSENRAQSKYIYEPLIKRKSPENTAQSEGETEKATNAKETKITKIPIPIAKRHEGKVPEVTIEPWKDLEKSAKSDSSTQILPGDELEDLCKPFKPLVQKEREYITFGDIFKPHQARSRVARMFQYVINKLRAIFGCKQGSEAETTRRGRIRKAIWEEINTAGRIYGKIFEFLSMIFILVTIIALCLESYESIRQSQCESGFPLTSGKTYPPPGNVSDLGSWCHANIITHLDIVEIVCLAWFTVEFVIYVWTSPVTRDFLLSFLGVVDMLSIFPIYVEYIMKLTRTMSENSPHIRIGFTIFRLLRVLRVLKTTRYSKGLMVVAAVFQKSFHDFLLVAVYTVIMTVFFATLVYHAEAREEGTAFTSIPVTAWWAIVTLTTLGYGDMVPSTAIGKVIAAWATLMGVVLLAFPVSIVVERYKIMYSELVANHYRVKSDNKDRQTMVGSPITRLIYSRAHKD